MLWVNNLFAIFFTHGASVHVSSAGLQKDIQEGGYGGYSPKIQAITVATLFTVVFSSGILVTIFPQLSVASVITFGKRASEWSAARFSLCVLTAGRRQSDRQGAYTVHVDDDVAKAMDPKQNDSVISHHEMGDEHRDDIF